MNKYPRVLAVITAVLFVAALVLGIAGIHTRYGDVKTTVAYGIDETSTGTGLNSEMMITYICDQETLSDEERDTVLDVLNARLRAYGINDAEVLYDSVNSIFAVKLAYSPRSVYDPNILYDYLGDVGSIQIRPGNEKGEDGLPSGATAEAIIAGNDDIKSLDLEIEGSGTFTQYNCEIHYGGAAKQVIREYSEKVSSSSESADKVYSIWLDGDMITSHSFTSPVKNGVVNAGTNVYSTTSMVSQYTGLRMLASSASLPFELTPAYVYDLSDPDNAKTFTGYMVLLAVAAAVLSVMLIARYRLSGVAALLGFVGFFGVGSIVMSGSLAPELGIYVSRNVLISIISSAVFVMISAVLMSEKLRSNLGDSTVFRTARDTFRGTELSYAAGLAVMAVITLLLYFLSAAVPVTRGLYEMFSSLTLFCAIGYVCVVLGMACIIKSFAATKKTSDEKYYGG